MEYQEIDGDLIKLAKDGKFDVIAHGCNCQSIMGAGIAPKMAKAFGCDEYVMEAWGPTIHKLGCIDYLPFYLDNGYTLTVVNAYTQYGLGRNHKHSIPLDYEALTICMRKINTTFSGKSIGLPQIGCGLAGGDWNLVKEIIQKELKDCNVTIVIFNQ